jgi:transcriptional regulator with XRE-family HTH domain
MKNLKLLRNETGISQYKLAEAVGSTQQAIHRYEHQDYEPDIETMTRLARFFGTSIDYLVGNTTIRNKIEKYDLNIEETVLVDKYRRLSPKQKKSINITLDTFISEP